MFKHLFLTVLVSLALKHACATTYYYQIGAGSTTTLGNWKTTRTGGTGTSPSNFTTANDLFVFQAGQSVNNSGTWNIGAAGLVVQVEATGTLTTSGNLNLLAGGTLQVDGTATIGSAMTLAAGCAIHITGGGLMTATATITTNSAATFTIDNTGTYVHNTTNNSVFGGTESFASNSNVKILKWTASTAFTAGITLPYGNLELALSGSSWNEDWTGTFVLCAGNLIVTSVGLGMTCVTNNSANVTVAGSFNMAAGPFDLSNGTGNCNLYLGGDFTLTGGTINATTGTGTFIFNKNGVQTFNRSGSGVIAGKPIGFTVLGGAILDMGTLSTNIIDNTTGNFTLLPGGGLKMGISPGISASGTTGHIQNVSPGLRTFSTGGYYTYRGTALQFTGTGLPSSVAGLAINNSSGLMFTNASTTVTDSITLTSGRIKPDATHGLTLAASCKVSSTVNVYGDVNEGNQASYISGPLNVIRSSTSLTTLPIGKDTATGSFFAPVKLTPTTAVTKTFTAEYYPKAHFDYTNVEAGTVDHVSVVEHWNISCNLASSPDREALVGLSWRPSSNVAFTGATASDSARAWDSLVVAHYLNKPPYLWSRDGAPATANDQIRAGSNLSYGYLTTRVSNAVYSSFTLGSRSAIRILPVRLLDWAGVKNGSQVILNWTTSEENNVARYEVQRSSDGIQFISIGNKPGLNIANLHQYSFTDYAPNAGMNYYRLQISDNAGRSSYSKTIAINFSVKTLLQVFPNPAINFIQVDFPSLKHSTELKIYSATGSLVHSVSLDAATNHKSVDVSRLSPGIYVIAMGNDNLIKASFRKL